MNEITKNYLKFRSSYFIDQFEYYFVPACFSIGLCGNGIGSLCFLSKRRLRKRTPLFVLACIGMCDTIFLSTQLQRWFAQNFGASVYLNTNSICKLYFMLMRSSVIISITLLYCMITSRCISIFSGSFRLSFYTNTGQIFSHLCVALSVAFCLSLSWHPLWTSG